MNQNGKWNAAIVFALVATSGTILAQRADRKGSADDQGPKLLVVQTTAKWCNVCQSAKEAYAAATKQFQEDRVLFVTLDRSDEFSARQSAYLASALGIEKSLGDKTNRVGEMFVINAATKQLVSKIALAPKAEAMSGPIKTALALRN